MEKCLICKRPLRPDEDSKNYVTGEWDGYTYFPCDCQGVLDENLRISIG